MGEAAGHAGLLLTVAYDGTAFSGFAAQPGRRTVQGVLQSAIATLTGERVELRGASRTDAGVHATGQRVAFDTARRMPLDRWVRAFGAVLDADVAVRAVHECDPGYNPRLDARHKRYRYLLHLGPARDPLWRTRAWHLGLRFAHPDARRGGPWLDVEAMRRAAALLVGTHDFSAFAAAGDRRADRTRTLFEVRVAERAHDEADLVSIDVVGTAFLQHMVRILVGTLVEVGRGHRAPEYVGTLLRPGASRASAGPTAPPHGLCLVEVALGRGAGSASGSYSALGSASDSG
ncbi:MAG: tRNA pseudouridine(38-40) synthase TruA [Myxococcales bacterium]|nr:tRNA pseudouridine(38-40) synthase TruA [Myxococcales bacterium]